VHHKFLDDDDNGDDVSQLAMTEVNRYMHLTRSTGTVHTSIKARLSWLSVVSRVT